MHGVIIGDVAGSVPHAIYCFLESNDFEDAIEKFYQLVAILIL